MAEGQLPACDGFYAIHEPLAAALLKGDADLTFALAGQHSQGDGTKLAAAVADADTVAAD